MKLMHWVMCRLGLHLRSSRPRGSRLQIFCKRCGRFL